MQWEKGLDILQYSASAVGLGHLIPTISNIVIAVFAVNFIANGAIMKTSYYAITPDTTPGAIAISLYPPPKTRYQQYKCLAPTQRLLNDYKAGRVDEEAYTRIYRADLAQLDPIVIWNVLHHMVDPNRVIEPILLCYERSGSFCHRRIVADWLGEAMGVEIPEYEKLLPVQQISLF
jgi:Protein of unknown function, DUF488